MQDIHFIVEGIEDSLEATMLPSKVFDLSPNETQTLKSRLDFGPMFPLNPSEFNFQFAKFAQLAIARDAVSAIGGKAFLHERHLFLREKGEE